MTATVRTSFDVSQYITDPIIVVEKPRDLAYFTPSSVHDSNSFGSWDFSSLPGFQVKPSSLPLCILDYAVQRHPRGIPYDQFPIVADPYCMLIEPLSGRSRVDGTATLSRERVEAIINSQDIFVYDEVGYSDCLTDMELNDALYLAVRTHGVLGEHKPFYYRQKGQTDFHMLPTAEVEAKFGGWQRFRYSYRTNFRAIAPRAINHVLNQYPLPDFDSADVIVRGNQRNYASMQRCFIEGRFTLLDEPIALQVLFWLRGLSKKEQQALFVLFHESSIIDRTPCTQLSFGNRICNGLWMGSGKYKFGFDVTSEVFHTLWRARVLGFVTDDRDGLIGLSTAGDAFLNCLHTDNDDPDAFHRFMDPDTMTMPSTQIERIDAWMMRFFRKMKTKVNSLK